MSLPGEENEELLAALLAFVAAHDALSTTSGTQP